MLIDKSGKVMEPVMPARPMRMSMFSRNFRPLLSQSGVVNDGRAGIEPVNIFRLMLGSSMLALNAGKTGMLKLGRLILARLKSTPRSRGGSSNLKSNFGRVMSKRSKTPSVAFMPMRRKLESKLMFIAVALLPIGMSRPLPPLMLEKLAYTDGNGIPLATAPLNSSTTSVALSVK